MINTILFDIDGTLRDERFGITPLSKKAIKLCQQNHLLVGVCTGRSLSTVQKEVLDMNFDILICADGSHVLIHQQTIVELYLTPANVLSILSQLTPTTGISIETDQGIFMNAIACEKLTQANEEKGIIDFSNEKIVYKNSMHLFDIRTMRVSKICLWKDSPLPLFKDVYYVIQSSHYDEIIHQDGGKGQGVKKVKEKLKLHSKNILCFGNGLNDISMFKECGHTVAMANSDPSLLLLANSITEQTMDEGIYKELVRRKMIEV